MRKIYRMLMINYAVNAKCQNSEMASHVEDYLNSVRYKKKTSVHCKITNIRIAADRKYHIYVDSI